MPATGIPVVTTATATAAAGSTDGGKPCLRQARGCQQWRSRGLYPRPLRGRRPSSRRAWRRRPCGPAGGRRARRREQRPGPGMRPRRGARTSRVPRGQAPGRRGRRPRPAPRVRGRRAARGGHDSRPRRACLENPLSPLGASHLRGRWHADLLKELVFRGETVRRA